MMSFTKKLEKIKIKKGKRINLVSQKKKKTRKRKKKKKRNKQKLLHKQGQRVKVLTFIMELHTILHQRS